MKQAIAGVDPATITAMLRTGALAIKPQDIGLTVAQCPQVWGLVMELGFAQVVASLVVLVDGSVSVYLSDGGGVIGCGLNSEVRTVARKMLQIAERTAVDCQPVTSHPLPSDSQVQFYLLTPGGIIGANASRCVLDEGAVELAELYYAGHGLIDVIELLGAGVDIIDEMRLAQNPSPVASNEAREVQADATGHPLNPFKARGRGCRILPSVGNAARRRHN